MGGTSSKHQETQDGWKPSLSRSASVPTSNDRPQEKSSTSGSWKSRLFSMPRSHNQGKRSKFYGGMPELNPVKEEEGELDAGYRSVFCEKDEYMNGFGRERQVCTPHGSDNGRFLIRSLTFQPVAGAECQGRSISPHRKRREDGDENVISGSMSISNNLPSRGLLDQGMGLRLVLSPTPSSSQSLVSPYRGAYPLERSLSTMGSFSARRANELTKIAFPRVCMDDTSPLEPQWVRAPSALNEADVPLFDPCILATVEKAVEDMAHSTMQSPPTIAPESASVSSETCRDVVGEKLLDDSGCTLSRLKLLRNRSARDDRSATHLPPLRTFSFLNRKPSFSRVLSLKNDTRNWSSQAYLDQFVRMCPPDCEGKVVLYFTSLRGVRKTFESCFMLRLILKGFRVHVDERDVWMHSKFRQELTEVMGTALSVPRLFILGRYVGGADEVELLHEEGILSKLLEGLPRECRQVCNVCADVRFIPCSTCSGSRKIVISNDVAERCSKCNENGLIMCPICD